MTTDTPRNPTGDTAFHELEERYRQLAEQSSDAITISQGGRIVYVNPAGAKLVGAGSASELLGKRVFDFIHPDHLEMARQRAQRVVSGRSLADRMEERWIRLNGEVFDVEVTSMPITFDGKPAAQIVIRDITDRKRSEAQLRESERRYRTIFESVGVAIYEADFSAVKSLLDELTRARIPDLRAYLHAHPEVVHRAMELVRIVDVNAAGLALVGALEQPDKLTSVLDIFLPETADVFIEELVVLAEGGSWLHSETALRTLDGKRIDVVLMMRMPSGVETGESVLVSMLDITDRKRAEAAVTESLATAEHALQVREEFLSVATHELRTPITSLRMAAQFVRRRFELAPNDLPAGFVHMAQVMDEQTNKLARMVDQLLDLSRLEGGRLVLDRGVVDLMPIIRSVADLGSTLSANHTFAVEGPAELVVDVDALRIEQVLMNLVANAVKFSPAGGTVSVVATRRPGNGVEVSVTDEGIGVPAEQRERIFERFYQVEPSERATGMGLGLFVCQQIIELHGGRIWMEASPTSGSRFVFHLPG